MSIALEQRKRKFGEVKEISLMNGILSKLVKPIKDKDLIKIKENKLIYNYKPDIKRSRVNRSLCYLEVPREFKSQNYSKCSIIDKQSKNNSNFMHVYSYKNNNIGVKTALNKSLDYILDENKYINNKLLKFQNTNITEFKYKFNSKGYHHVNESTKWIPVKKEYKLVT